MTPNAQEQAILKQLGITDFSSINAIIILEQSAHLDWDWTSTFLDYYNGDNSGHPAVSTTYTQAIASMQKYQSQACKYFYAFCEMSYLRQYLHDPNYQSQLQNLQKLLNVISISGGGITSAENLVCHGEAFIRNYLVGQKWLNDTLGFTYVGQLWIPDDFGHDAQIPIVVNAMGYQGVGFERIPVSAAPCMSNAELAPNCPCAYFTQNKQLDFLWQAADGSQIQAHWLSNLYCEGDPSSLTEYQGHNMDWKDSSVQSALTQFVTENLSVTNITKIPYMFVPVDCDFAAPYLNLVDMVTNWNICNGFGSNPCLTCPAQNPAKGIYMVMATFDVFMRLLQAHTATGQDGSSLPVVTFGSNQRATVMSPNPYYSGCYVSHPDLKQNHYAATRALLAAEAFEMIVEYLAVEDPTTWAVQAASFRNALATNWDALMPSTHHDYVVGTAPDDVYTQEQSPGLINCLNQSNQLEEKILDAVSSAIKSSPPSGWQPVAVFNAIGVAQSGLVSMTPPGNGPWRSVNIDGDYYPVQTAVDGSLLFLAEAPSYGYSVYYLSPQESGPSSPPLCQCYDPTTQTYTLTNQYVEAVIGVQGIVSLTDLALNKKQVLSEVGNQVVFYEDGGTIYRFGNEIVGGNNGNPCNSAPSGSPAPCGVTFKPAPQSALQNAQISLIENGPLLVTVQVSGSFTVQQDGSNSSSVNFQMTYSLVAGEPCLRISTTGAAPEWYSSGGSVIGYSVMVVFPFTGLGALTHGTAYHFETGEARHFWTNRYTESTYPLTFEATHEFVQPLNSGGVPLAAIYHASTPAWGIDYQGNLVGCILRNTPSDSCNGASGTDTATHTASYAVRVPGGTMQSPAAGGQPGAPLGEALKFNNPLVGVALPATPVGSAPLPEYMSIAATADPTALITAIKAGTFVETDMIVRVYQPTNSPIAALTVNLDPGIAGVFQPQQNAPSMVTALEKGIPNSPVVTASAQSFTFPAPLALSTVALSRTSPSTIQAKNYTR